MSRKRINITKKGFFLDYLLSIVIELIILFGLMGFCALFIYRGDLIQETKLIGSETSSPTTGRLLYLFISLFTSVALCIVASLLARKEKDVPAFWCGYASGILLWQALGEEAWHFSVGGINFVQLESVSSFPVILAFIALIVYAYKKRSFDWGIWITIISFACNWLGHYVTVGVYPFFEKWVESRVWNVCAGSIGGGLVFILSIVYLLFHSETRKGRMFASLLTYISIGITALSIIDG